MLNRVVAITLLVLVAMAVYAKGKESIQIRVVSARTRVHGVPPGEAFEYTDIMFAVVNNKNITYECDQRGNDCPVMEPGKTYTADREGKEIYLSIPAPKGKPVLVKYKEIGNW